MPMLFVLVACICSLKNTSASDVSSSKPSQPSKWAKVGQHFSSPYNGDILPVTVLRSSSRPGAGVA